MSLPALASPMVSVPASGHSPASGVRESSPGLAPVKRLTIWNARRVGESIAFHALNQAGKSFAAMPFCSPVPRAFRRLQLGRSLSTTQVPLGAARTMHDDRGAWFADVGPLRFTTSRCQSSIVSGRSAISANVHRAPFRQHQLLAECSDIFGPTWRLAVGGRLAFQIIHILIEGVGEFYAAALVRRRVPLMAPPVVRERHRGRRQRSTCHGARCNVGSGPRYTAGGAFGSLAVPANGVTLPPPMKVRRLPGHSGRAAQHVSRACHGHSRRL